MTARRPSMPDSRPLRVDVLPREQEAHEVGRRRPARSRRAGGSACSGGCARAAARSHHSTSASGGRSASVETSRAGRRLRLRARAAPRPTSRRRNRRATRRARAAVVGPEQRQPAAQELDERVLARPGPRGARRRARRSAVRTHARDGSRSSSGSRSAATQADWRTGSRARRRPAGAAERVEQLRPASPRRRRRSGSRPSAARRAARRRRAGRAAASSRTRSIAAGVERAELARRRLAGAPRVDRLRAPLLERRVVEERVRPRVEDLVRRAATARACRARRSAISPRVDARRARAASPSKSIASSRQSRTRLLDERMIGDLAVAGDVLEAGGGVGEHRGQQVVGQHPLQLRRHLACRRGCAARPARCVVFQRQRVWNIGASRNACTSDVARGRRVQVAEDVGERERVLRAEREQQRVLGRRRLQLEVELPAEALAQREPPRRLMRLPNGACSTSCMPPDSSKKRSSTSVSCVGSDAERARGRRRGRRRSVRRRRRGTCRSRRRASRSRRRARVRARLVEAARIDRPRADR